MNADELYRTGQLTKAVEAQIQAVKQAPGDQNKRLFLFELMAFSSEWDRARRQVDALKYEDPALEAAVRGYQKLLDAEDARRKLFSDGLRPNFLGPVPHHVELRLQAIDDLRAGRKAEASKLLLEANAQTPHWKGKLNDKEFDGFRDADDLLCGVFEVLAQGKYFWAPMEIVLALGANPPKYPRDLLWFPARLETVDGQNGEVYLPTTYPVWEKVEDDGMKLGRTTDWHTLEGGAVLGKGGKLFLVGDDGHPLIDFRALELEQEIDESEDEADHASETPAVE